MNRLNKLEVFYHERLIGTIALYQNRLAAFEYDSNWLANGFSISPFSLPLEKKVFIPKIDDHSKNFTYLYDEDECSWKLSPAYDLTYSNSIGGEHATTVNGNGVNPELDDILAVAQKIGLNMTMARKTALNIRNCVSEMLGEYL